MAAYPFGTGDQITCRHAKINAKLINVVKTTKRFEENL